MTTPLTPVQAITLVARREFVTQVRNKSFVIGLVVTLAFFVVIGVITAFVSAQGSSATLGITSAARALQPTLEDAAGAGDFTLEIREIDAAAGRAAVAAGELDALLDGSGPYTLLGRDQVANDLVALVGATVQQASLADALRAAGTDPATVAVRGAVRTETTEPVDPDRGQRLGLAIIGTILLFFSVSGYGQLVATGVVEEKQSRVVELLLATIKPWELLAGKILGLGAVGLLNLLILGAVGVVGGLAFGVLTLPGATAGIFAMVILWYLLGFFLYAALYAAVGSMVSRQEELGSVIAPMIFLLLIPFILTVNLLPSDPRNPIATVLSYLPFFSQTVMPARYVLGAAELWEVAVSAVLAIAAIVLVVLAGARIYRNSILRTGARVSWREALGR